jgi:hypothetical protein
MAGQGLQMPVMDGYGRKEVLKQAEESGIGVFLIGLEEVTLTADVKKVIGFDSGPANFAHRARFLGTFDDCSRSLALGTAVGIVRILRKR